MNTEQIDLIGVGADGPAGLRPDLRDRVRAAEFLAGGERLLGLFPEVVADRFVIRERPEALADELLTRIDRQRCVVLAAGDPMFFGIGRVLAERLGPERLRVEPAVSSLQLLFARAGWAWDGAAVSGAYPRTLRKQLLPLLGRRLIGLCTTDGDGPALVADFFHHFGLDGYEAVVGENLGGPDERVTRFKTLGQVRGQRFAPLNVVALRRNGTSEAAALRDLVPGVPDGRFVCPPDGREVMTRQEVRAVAVAKLLSGGPLSAGDVAWDLGAGLGTVSVELAVLRPQLEVVAVERDPERAAFLGANRLAFGAYNIRLVTGTAPEALKGEAEDPRLVFVGGSGKHLGAILEMLHARLVPGGRFVASFVTLENLTGTLQRMQEWAWPFEVTEVHVSRSQHPAPTALKPQRGVFLVSADRPAKG
jgi:precorrin-6Y C5,15-methyltransferase (decarboxylating)